MLHCTRHRENKRQWRWRWRCATDRFCVHWCFEIDNNQLEWNDLNIDHSRTYRKKNNSKRRITSKAIIFKLRTTIVRKNCIHDRIGRWLCEGKKGGYWNIPVIESDPYYCAVWTFRLFRWTMGKSGDGDGSDWGGGGDDDGGGWTHRSPAYSDDSHSSTSRALQNYIHFSISRSHWAAAAAAAATISDCAFLRYVYFYAGSARIHSLLSFFYSLHSGIFVRALLFFLCEKNDSFLWKEWKESQRSNLFLALNFARVSPWLTMFHYEYILRVSVYVCVFISLCSLHKPFAILFWIIDVLLMLYAALWWPSLHRFFFFSLLHLPCWTIKFATLFFLSLSFSLRLFLFLPFALFRFSGKIKLIHFYVKIRRDLHFFFNARPL